MGEETLNGDLPPAYCSIFRPGNCSDRVNTSEEIVSDPDEEPLVAPSFENQSTRIVFIQKVLAIHCIQVAAASGIIGAIYRLANFYYWFRSDHFYYWRMALYLVHAATVIPLFYWKNAAKKTPYNYLLLVTNTVSTPFILMVITIGFLQIGDEFFIAWIFYGVLTLALFLYTVLIPGTSLEFRARDASLLTGGLSILMIAITTISCNPYDVFTIIYLELGLFVLCAHAVYRLQVITSGEYHRALTPADFLSAVLYSQVDLVRDFANWPVCLIKSISD